MMTVVLQSMRCAGVDYSRGQMLDTVGLHPTLEQQLIDQRIIRQAILEEIETHRLATAERPSDAQSPKVKTKRSLNEGPTKH